ncbi:MAG: hypothetical protein DCC58_08930 [Chloroflexi bacterium]|nr:MAG: hypothetical protein DCC58_08930 [Chloroflexota bacterium]
MRIRVSTRVAAFFALALLVPLIAACGGGGDDEDQPTATATPDSAATSVSSPVTTAAPEATGTQRSTPALPTQPPPGPSPTPPATFTPAPTPGPTRTSTVDHRTEEFAYGWNVAWRGDDNGADFNQQTIGAVQDSGFGWVRFQVEWSQFERAPDAWDPLPVDRVVDAYAAAGINVLIVVAKAPQWAVDPNGDQLLADWGEFEQFMFFMADRYKGKVQAWEIWNEQNLASEMGGTVRPRDYFELLKAGSAGVRAGDPDAKVVFGGLTPNGVNDPSIAYDDLQYLQLIYGLNGGEISQYFDIMGMHLSSTHNDPDWMYPDNPGTEQGYNDHASFFFRRGEQLRQVMLNNGDDAKPVWITEFGWTTENQAPGYEYGVNNTEEEVAQFLVRAFEIATTEWDFVTGAFVWNLNWSTLAPPESEISPWSALNADWTPRPAYEALKAMPKE